MALNTVASTPLSENASENGADDGLRSAADDEEDASIFDRAAL